MNGEKEITTRVGEAIAFAAEKHAFQTRRNGDPYILHPMAVYQKIKELGYGEEYQLAAILHDILEDTDATEDEVMRFGEEVFHAVDILTRRKGMKESVYVDRVLNNHIAAVIKNADKINNLQDALLCNNDVEFAKRYVNKTREFYYDKFSPALNNTVDCAEIALQDHSILKPEEVVFETGYSLIQDIKNEIKEYRRTQYLSSEKPSLSYDCLSFFYRAHGWSDAGHYYCVYDWPGPFGVMPKSWILTDYGWIPNRINLKDCWEGMHEKTIEEVLQAIEDWKQEGRFSEEIDADKLWAE